jgi:hypothetical protein
MKLQRSALIWLRCPVLLPIFSDVKELSQASDLLLGPCRIGLANIAHFSSVSICQAGEGGGTQSPSGLVTASPRLAYAYDAAAAGPGIQHQL